MLYATAADRVVALRAESGAEIWRFSLPRGAPSQRGLAYWPGDAATPARIFFTAGRALLALDAATGMPVPTFGTEGEASMPAVYNGAPTRFGDLLIVGSNGPPGGVRAYDARTGAELWSATLANNANANPMTYAGPSGKQRVAIVAGDTVSVFALP